MMVQADAAETPPRRFSVGIELPTLVPYPASLRKALGDLGIDYVNYYVKPSAGVPDAEAERVNEAMLALGNELGLDFSLSCYVVDPPDSCIQAAKRSGGERFRGVVFDELAHCRLVNLYMHPGADVLADPKEFRTLDAAYTGFPDALYGSPHLKSTADTEAWLGLWDVLTHGATGRDGITYFKQTVTGYGYQRGVGGDEVLSLHSRPLQAEQHPFFAPLNGVVVFDHTVAYERLAGSPLLFATGVSLSEETWRALERCADEGATVVVWGPLAARRGEKWKPEEGVVAKTRGKGKWVLTPDFGHAGLREHIRAHLGHPDEIRYRFGDRTVRLRRLTPNTVDVQIGP